MSTASRKDAKAPRRPQGEVDMGRRTRRSCIVTGYAHMGPREVFDIRAGRRFLDILIEPLDHAGVYVLYRDDHPYYVGKTSGSLFRRIHAHANRPYDPYYHFWNFFSVFVVPEPQNIGEVEGILIAAMPTANSANARIRRINLPAKVGRLLAERRLITPAG